jgi:hypothetical protein
MARSARSALGRAFDRAAADRRAGRELGHRMGDAGLDHHDAEALIDLVSDADLLNGVTKSALDSMKASVRDTADKLGEPGAAEYAIVVSAMLDVLLHLDESQAEGFRLLTRQVTTFAALDGFLVGSRYVYEQIEGQARRHDRRRRRSLR